MFITLCLPTSEVFKSSLEEFLETNRQQLLESIVKTDNMAPNPRLHTWLVLTRDKFVESLTKLPWNHSDHPMPESELTLLGCPYESLALRLQAKAHREKVAAEIAQYFSQHHQAVSKKDFLKTNLVSCEEIQVMMPHKYPIQWIYAGCLHLTEATADDISPEDWRRDVEERAAWPEDYASPNAKPSHPEEIAQLEQLWYDGGMQQALGPLSLPVSAHGINWLTPFKCLSDQDGDGDGHPFAAAIRMIHGGGPVPSWLQQLDHEALPSNATRARLLRLALHPDLGIGGPFLAHGFQRCCEVFCKLHGNTQQQQHSRAGAKRESGGTRGAGGGGEGRDG